MVVQQRYAVHFTLNDKEVQHWIIQTDDQFEAFFYEKSIGIYDNFYKAADAVRWIAMLEVWVPTTKH